MKEKKFQLVSDYSPAGDQPAAIDQLVANIESGIEHQVLLGVTGSGKTYTMANVIARLNRPAMILAHNKTLAAQLYSEMKSFFPNNAVEYFVSYYDYYQPEAYIPTTDTFIEKDSAVNDRIEQMRLSATKALMERRDVVIVASVSAIYGLGDPESEMKMMLHLSVGETVSQRDILRRLAELQYERSDDFYRATFRVRGDVIDIFPAESEGDAVRVELFDDEVERITVFDSLTGHFVEELKRVSIFPKSHYVTPKDVLAKAMAQIKADLKVRKKELLDEGKLLEEQRITQRTTFDLEMIQEIGYCSGIENYSRYLSGRAPGEPPPCLFDYLPDDGLLIIDESHVTLPQIGAMYKGDRSRKENLVNYGFRLPSALDNRPLRFEEFAAIQPQTIYVSATPADYELEKSSGLIVEQVVRPTGLLDPKIEVRSAQGQVDDVLGEIKRVTAAGGRILVTTLTKRMAEELTDYLDENGIRVRYLHSDIDTVERVQIVRDLRLGEFDVLVGINLLREGLDIPEVAAVAILDADKEGFLRSTRSLIQTIGRAARNVSGVAILYADKITDSMKSAIEETERRRKKQHEFNVEHGIVPKQIIKKVDAMLDIAGGTVGAKNTKADTKKAASKRREDIELLRDPNKLAEEIKNTEKKMREKAANLEFEAAAMLRDELKRLQQLMIAPL